MPIYIAPFNTSRGPVQAGNVPALRILEALLQRAGVEKEASVFVDPNRSSDWTAANRARNEIRLGLRGVNRDEGAVAFAHEVGHLTGQPEQPSGKITPGVERRWRLQNEILADQWREKNTGGLGVRARRLKGRFYYDKRGGDIVVPGRLTMVPPKRRWGELQKMVRADKGILPVLAMVAGLSAMASLMGRKEENHG